MTNTEKHEYALKEMKQLKENIGKEVEVISMKRGQRYTIHGILTSVVPFGGVEVQENNIVSGISVFIGVDSIILSITKKETGEVLYSNADARWTEDDWNRYESHMNDLREAKYGTTAYSASLAM